ncbi:hypothetical protein [Rufibacter hautae]|uniref:Uncharacterized protein n=1 Tax=Rufibacter hautae TaxID=2595005 RepID=A0A5B6TMR0_9BACT|nr:hypothetical protein [Rufibacter hautae]KAA3437603.1 hypothetical protein FOA19_09825 [Rufibacter hautae]
MKKIYSIILFVSVLATISSCSSKSKKSSNDYEYNVSGVDEDGDDVDGEVEVTKEGGSGTITDEYGNEKEVDVEWTGKGELEATDEDGETYELEVE